jgi:hypothetical protein
MMRNLSAYTFVILAFLISLGGCTTDQDNANTTATSTVTPPPTQRLQLTSEPPRITELRKTRGEQDQAKPVLKIVSPADSSTVDGSTVQVRLTLSGDLKGYQPHKDPATGTGNHIHVILDDNPYEAYYDLNVPFELKNVTPGKHLLRVFPSRPWHESYKNDGAFQLAMFTVNGGGDASKPTTTGTGQTMADNNSNQNATQQSIAVDRTKPLLTYSRPKGEYKGEEADPIMIDFWLSNAKLKGDGGDYRVRYIVDDDEPRFMDKWEPVWLAGWLNGKHTVRLELIGPDGYPFKNGSLNITTREITVVK